MVLQPQTARERQVRSSAGSSSSPLSTGAKDEIGSISNTTPQLLSVYMVSAVYLFPLNTDNDIHWVFRQLSCLVYVGF